MAIRWEGSDLVKIYYQEALTKFTTLLMVEDKEYLRLLLKVPLANSIWEGKTEFWYLLLSLYFLPSCWSLLSPVKAMWSWHESVITWFLRFICILATKYHNFSCSQCHSEQYHSRNIEFQYPQLTTFIRLIISWSVSHDIVIPVTRSFISWCPIPFSAITLMTSRAVILVVVVR